MKTIFTIKNTLKVFLLLAALSAFSTCKKEETNPTPENLISNSSFENDGESSAEGWEGYFAFTDDTPQNGGNWALQLEPGWLPAEGYATTSVSGLSGNLSFTLKCDAKLIGSDAGQRGVYLRLKKADDTLFTLASISVENTEWENLTLSTGTVEMEETDELIVHLSAGSTEVAGWKVLFDNVVLEKMED